MSNDGLHGFVHFKTPNEIRAEAGLEPIERWSTDEFFTQGSPIRTFGLVDCVVPSRIRRWWKRLWYKPKHAKKEYDPFAEVNW